MFNTIKLVWSVLVNSITFFRNLEEAKPYLKDSPTAYHNLMHSIRTSGMPPKMKEYILSEVRKALA